MWEFRASSSADAPWMAELRAHVLRDDLERLGRYDEVRVRQRFLDAFNPAHTRVITCGDQDVGLIAVRPDTDALWLEHFYLAASHQGLGIGTEVLNQVLSESLDPRPIRLNVLQGSPARRLYERHGFALEHEDPIDTFLVANPAVLSLKNVDLVRESRQILHDINFTVQAGEHWALLGANGAGKSTILSMCGAVTHPTRGTVHVLGHKLGRVDIRELRHSIGHVNPRHPLTSPLTVTQVVLTGATGSVEFVPRWVPSPAILDRARELIHTLGLSHRIDAPWTVLSQGERGRTLIARALLPSPPLLLLDEPSTGLDVASREQLLRTLDHLHRTQPQLATVLVTHHLEELPSTTTHAMLIKDGRLLAHGDAHAVLTTDTISNCFSYPIEIEHRGNRWLARAGDIPDDTVLQTVLS